MPQLRGSSATSNALAQPEERQDRDDDDDCADDVDDAIHDSSFPCWFDTGCDERERSGAAAGRPVR